MSSFNPPHLISHTFTNRQIKPAPAIMGACRGHLSPHELKQVFKETFNPSCILYS